MLPQTITFSQDLKHELQAFFQKHSFSKIGVLVDENTEAHCYSLIQSFLPEHSKLQIKSGEEHKNLLTCQEIWKWMTDECFDRNALLINLGGGVIGDMGGFCASAFKRGIAFINIPTTLLSQVDASIGGKLGIDFMGFKNHLGFFREPEQVFISTNFLPTLPPRELRSGFAEIIKHCLIADEDAWKTLLTKKIEEINWNEQISHSVAIKHKIVVEDPTEKGLRKILNFGHTIGHAIESYYLPTSQRLLHGEAIAVGMICEAYLSSHFLDLDMQTVGRIASYLLDTFGKITLDPEAFEAIALLALQDKKNRGGSINCVMLSQVGKAEYDIPIVTEHVQKALNYYRKLVG